MVEATRTGFKFFNLNRRGFTLIELLITLTILGIILAFVTPSFKTILMNARISMQVDGLVNGLSYARETALAQNISTKMCPYSAANSTSCGTNWSNGWIVITQPASNTPVLLQSSQSQTTTSGPQISAPGVSDVTFSATGLASSQANFAVCDSRGGAYAGSVTVLATGFIQAGSTLGKSAWSGGAISCS
ncbi:MAG: type IV pre-pilin [Legionellaceae bacterium]|nr:type IV pre-pilin [Legionellaceae bacterium]HCA89056.1 type IV pre-pilin [Legionellales bacterium]|tara:strand:- start:236 stop:802 length:567 start_codon:yes stop_codon:yes gene_type:complete